MNFLQSKKVKQSSVFSVRNCIALLFFTTLLCFKVFAQESQQFIVPKTEYGYSDLQGLWTDKTRTPFERPLNLGLQQVYSEEDIAELEQRAISISNGLQQPLDPNREAPPLGAVITNQPDANFNGFPMTYVPVKDEYRTSIIVNPKNGRLPFKSDPPMDIFAKRAAAGKGVFDGPENRPSNERCLGVPGQLPIIVPLPIDGPWRNIQIVQNKDYVLIFGEYHMTARIIRLNSTHQDPGFAKYYGDSIGRWEDDTLVIKTKSFKPDQSDRRLPSSGVLEIVERMTPVSNSEILYQYKITDTEIYTQTITAEMTLSRMPADDKLYESACHEGNYSLPSILAGARRQEADSR
jgi:hypothetical protein